MIFKPRFLVCIILSSWYHGSFGDTSDTTLQIPCEPGLSEEEESACTIEEQEEDEGSLLQVKLITQKEDEKHSKHSQSGHQQEKDGNLTVIELHKSSAHHGLALNQTSNLSDARQGSDSVSFASFALYVHQQFVQQHGARDNSAFYVIVGLVTLLFLGICLTICSSLASGSGNSKHKGPPADYKSPQQLASRGAGRGKGGSPTAFPRSPLLSTNSPAQSLHPERKSPESYSRTPIQGQQSRGSPPGMPHQAVPTIEGMPGIPLCSSLMIPAGTSFRCLVKRCLSREKQSLSFDIRSLPERGGEPLLKAFVSEMNSHGTSGIYITTLDGLETLAILSTSELWSSPTPDPVLTIFRQSKAIFGTVKKNGNDGVMVLRGQTRLLTLSGDFTKPNLRALDSEGRLVATMKEYASDECELEVQPRNDPGLIILTLLAADKLGFR